MMLSRDLFYGRIIKTVLCSALLTVFIGLSSGCRDRSLLDLPSLTREEAMDLLVEAEGFAAVYNVEKAVQITDRVLSSTGDAIPQTRAFWVRAAAYGHFMVEYRSQVYEKKRQAALAQLAVLNRESISYELTHQNAALLFCCPEPETLLQADGIVDRERAALLAKTPHEPMDQYRFAMICFQAGLYCERIGIPRRGMIYFRESVEHLAKLSRKMPDFYEGRAYYVTLLGRAERFEDARIEAEKLYGQANVPYPPFNDKGPFCLHVAAVGNLSRRMALEMLLTHVEEGGKDPWAYFIKVSNDVEGTRGAENRVKAFADLAKKMEKGKLSTRGTYLAALAATYYQLASRQTQANMFDEALETYAKLVRLSPHYAQIHQNQAIILSGLARGEKDETKRKALLDEALAQLRLQAKYNWHGKGTAEANAMIGMLGG